MIESGGCNVNAPIETGHHSTGWANLANIAFQAGLEPFGIRTDQLVSSPVFTHDPLTESFVGEHAELANRFLKRE